MSVIINYFNKIPFIIVAVNHFIHLPIVFYNYLNISMLFMIIPDLVLYSFQLIYLNNKPFNETCPVYL